MLNQRTEDIPEARIIYLTGALNTSNHIALSRLLDEPFQLNISSVILDFSDVTVLTSAAQRVIFEAYLNSSANQINEGIMLCCLNKDIEWLIEITGLSRLVSIYPSLNIALRAITST